MNEIENKLEKMLKLLEEDFKVEYDSLKRKYEEEYNKVVESYEEEIKKISNKKIKEANEKANHIVKLAKSKSELQLKQEKLKLKNDLLMKILANLEEKLIDLEPKKKKYFYEKLYNDAVKIIDEDFIVLCNSKDVDIVKSFITDHQIKADDTIKGGIILKGKNLIIRNTIESYIQENKNKIFGFVLEEVGDINAD
ncbi:V-type ATP synthase subunit E family protein [Marinitoga lauensis]|uniref:V-type ATP synthase subunit E family protein n=1 Tax=Marinitoga lauensis TaxID=2201189 RepID=UPI00101365D4|nr:V-type ATP synthase subunit E family protein [Marinitoga lauensis]